MKSFPSPVSVLHPVRLIFVMVTVLSLAGYGCGDDERPTCDELGELCHESTTQQGIDCHETSEEAATTEEECQEMETACRAACAP